MTRLSTLHYLDQDHPDFRWLGIGNRALSVHIVLSATLAAGQRFVVQFERSILIEALTENALRDLMPRLPELSRTPPHLYETYEDELTGSQRLTLRRALSPIIADPSTRLVPRWGIRSVRVRDAQGKTVLRVGDHGNEMFFALPPLDHARLVREYELAHLPVTVIGPSDIDVESLQP